jgi:hypothetical protein
LNTWLNNSGARGGLTYNNLNTGASGSVSKGHGINSIYAYNSVPMNVNQLPAVRLTDGAQLPNSGLTVVTPQPMYVEGNYNVQTNGTAANASAQTTNTAYTVPASIMADAITILSPSWSDTYNINTPLTASSGTQRQASVDSVSAALLVGIVPSVTTAGGKQYSGGLENYLRLLENWSGISLQYNGSEVGMYSSLYATNFWPGTGTVYNAPNRNWGFDNNFMNYAKLPPLTPEFKAISRFTWLAW